jgi:hypothetical protein
MAQIEKEHAGSGIDKPAPKTIREKIADGLRSRADTGPADKKQTGAAPARTQSETAGR